MKPNSLSKNSPAVRHGKTISKKNDQHLTRVFISYRWDDTKTIVRKIADDLKKTGKFKVWIDTEEMFGDKNARMEEGIRWSDLVLIFFSDAYQSSKDCKKEADSTDRNNKPAVFVKMQKGPCTIQSWFAPIIQSSIFIDYFKFEEKARLEIEKHIDQTLKESKSKNVAKYVEENPMKKQQMIYVKVPKFDQYQSRADETRILEMIKEINQSADKGGRGIFVVYGEGGCGKTTIISQMVYKQSQFLQNECGISVVLWLNCYKWAGDGFDQEDFIRSIVKLAELGNGGIEEFKNVDKACFHFKNKNQKVMLILDDVFNPKIVETVEENCPSFSCLLITRDVTELNVPSYELRELGEGEIVEMFKEAYKFKDKLSDEQLDLLAKKCCGLPIVVDLLAARFRNRKSKSEIQAEFQIIMDNIKLISLKVSSRFATISCLFGFSLEQMEDSLRTDFYAFLLFDPMEPVSVESLAIIWHCNSTQAMARCSSYSDRSLLRRQRDKRTNEKRKKCKEEEDVFIVHQLIHESTVENAIRHGIGKDLSEIRTSILTCFTGNVEKLLAILLQCLENKFRPLIELIFDRCEETSLAQVCKCPVKSDGRSFIHYFYQSPPIYLNIVDKIMGENYAAKLVFQLVIRLLKYNGNNSSTTSINITDIFVEPNERNCLLVDIFQRKNEIDNALFMLLHPIRDVMITHKRIKWQIDNERYETDPLIMAAGVGDLDQVQKLANWENVMEIVNFKGNTALTTACSLGHFDIVKFLFQLNPTKEHYEITNISGFDAFFQAASTDLEIVKFLYENIDDKKKLLEPRQVNLGNELGKESVFTVAAISGNLEIVKFLYEIKPQLIDFVSSNGSNALDYAVQSGNLATVEFLYSKVKFLSSKNQTKALIYAVGSGNLEMVKFLCQVATIDVNRMNDNQQSAMMIAIQFGHFEMVKFLYQQDPVAAIKGTCEFTPLLVAATFNKLEIFEFLFFKLDNVEEKEEEETEIFLRFFNDLNCLHAAVIVGNLEMVKLICGDGKPNVRKLELIRKVGGSKTKENAYQIAIRSGHSQIAQYLKTFFQ